MAKYNVSKSEAKRLGIKRYKIEDSGGGGSYKDMIDSIMDNTPAQNDVLPDFEETYTEDMEAEDYAQSEALYTPYFENQIADELEDLNAWNEAESVSYDRTLRRARFSLAAGGGAIGTEREAQEGEITDDHNRSVNNAVRATERQVGTNNVQGAGFNSAGREQEGAIVGDMTTAIQEGQLWHKNQRAQRYYGDAQTYYAQPNAYALSGNKL